MQKKIISSFNLLFLEAFAVSFRAGILLGGVLVACVDSITSICFFAAECLDAHADTIITMKVFMQRNSQENIIWVWQDPNLENPPTMFCWVIHVGRFPPKSKNKTYHDMDIFQKHKKVFTKRKFPSVRISDWTLRWRR